MSEPVRLAGWGRILDATVTWTIAEGRRGRRWREVITREDAVVHALLLETDADRRFSHLELSVPEALVTLHPEGDGTLHGNRVGAGGGAVVEHVVGVPFEPGALVLVEGSSLAQAAIAWALADQVDAPAVVTRSVVLVGRFGHVSPPATIAIARMSDDTWGIGGGEPFEVHADGTPGLQDGVHEPLGG